MPHLEINEINPMSTTFKQLKAMVARTDGQPLPTACALRASRCEIFFTKRYEDISLTVYKNGFFIYEYDGKESVYAVDRCTQFLYRYQDGESVMLYESEFANGSCLVPLLLAGDRRREHNVRTRDGRWGGAAVFDSEGEIVHFHQYEDSAEDEFIRREDFLDEESRYLAAMEHLTERQQQVFRLYIQESWSFRRIARELNLSQETVRQHFEAAKRRLKNFYENF